MSLYKNYIVLRYPLPLPKYLPEEHELRHFSFKHSYFTIHDTPQLAKDVDSYFYFVDEEGYLYLLDTGVKKKVCYTGHIFFTDNISIPKMKNKYKICFGARFEKGLLLEIILMEFDMKEKFPEKVCFPDAGLGNKKLNKKQKKLQKRNHGAYNLGNVIREENPDGTVSYTTGVRVNYHNNFKQNELDKRKHIINMVFGDAFPEERAKYIEQINQTKI